MELSHPVSEGTVKNFKCKYLEQLKSVTNPDLVTSLPSAAVGRPLLIGKFDDEVLDMLKSNNIHQIFVPASCTRELQPLDVGINDQFKTLLKQEFSRWYANEVQEAMRN